MSESNYIINKRRVILSAFWIPLASMLMGFSLGLMDGGEFGDANIGEWFGIALLSLIVGAFIWIPTIVLCMAAEAVMINDNTTKGIVGIIFISEAVMAMLVISLIFDTSPATNEFLLPLVLSIGITQLIRWWHLNYKKRIYKNPPTEEESISDILDDIT